MAPPNPPMVFGPLRGRPAAYTSAAIPCPWSSNRYLGVVLSSILSWRPHVDFLCSRQASAWCVGEGLPLSFTSSIFVTVLSSSSFGLEFIGDDHPALQQFNLALRRWCRHLLGWPSASPVAAAHWELVIGDALHLALGRAFSLVERLCAVDHASPRPPVTANVFRLCSSAQGTWSHWCASALHSFSIPLPDHMGISPASAPSSLHRWFSQEASPRLDRALRYRISAMVSDLHGVHVDVFSDNFLPVREIPVYSFNLPPCLSSPAGAMTTPPQAVPLVTGRVLPPAPSAMTRTAPSCITFPLALATTTLELPWLTPVASPCLLLRRWHNTVGFNPLDEANTPQTIRPLRWAHL